MNHFDKLKQQVQLRLLIYFLLSNGVVLTIVLLLNLFTNIRGILSIGIGALVAITISIFLSSKGAKYALEPLFNIWLAILHVAPNHTADAPAPEIEYVKVGKDLIASLIPQIYQLASQEDTKSLVEHRTTMIQSANIVSHLPLPLFVFNKQQVVVSASDTAMEYFKVDSAHLFGKPLYETLNFEFSNEHTLEEWVIDCQKNKVTDTAFWQRVHVRLPDSELRQCDIAAYYNRDNPSGSEYIVTLFDHTKQYDQDDKDISFIALAVHELRTPLTMLRGYIEVFQEELEGKLDPELAGFMQKMIVSAQQLGAFFNNILNVARVEQNQLVLKLNQDNWQEILSAACQELNLRATVHNRKLSLNIASDLPPVAVDKVSIIEVINNLIDNAIKYSEDGGTITIDSRLNKEGYIQTTVMDHGTGIPIGVIPNLFDKFYRNHRTSNQVGGTGLGLYICKSIVSAHGGEIWVQSHEGEGSTFGFTILPASKLAAELKAGNNDGIVRNAHGWIKNHSLYRR